MEVLLLKVLLTPSLVLFVSLVQRRWGHLLGGQLTALPLTSGPFVLILACTEGAEAGRVAVRGILLGTPAVLVFCLAYGLLARRRGWVGCLSASALATVATSGLVVLLSPPLWCSLVFTAVTLIGVFLAQRRTRVVTVPPTGPAWELAARVVISAVLVGALSWTAARVGAGPAGVLATFPALACVLTAFTHRLDGAAAPIQLTRGVLAGVPATVLFFLCLLGTLTWLPIALAFGLAGLVVAVAGALLPRLATARRPSVMAV
ncbi:hypothetical protein ACFWY9_03285 [Amycolatopsis sp. NPDC059027]|uniref:hypothetical protein n=1 Tax=Amycolatopsis sp. NPDC059027 TaxID=3346709 RepID=UPI00366DEBF1